VCVLARHVEEVRRGNRRPKFAARVAAWLASVGIAYDKRRFAPYY
jgi:hypothetical protein